MDAADKRLCDLIQNEFPVVERPYAAIGERLEMGEDEVLERVQRLRSERIIRQISAIFDTRKLGYRSMLVAARAPAERADEAAEVISTHPGVTHNYERKHEFNIWFTLGVPPTSRLGLDRSVAPALGLRQPRRRGWRSEAERRLGPGPRQRDACAVDVGEHPRAHEVVREDQHDLEEEADEEEA